MTISSLYHTQGIRGYNYQKTERTPETEIYYLLLSYIKFMTKAGMSLTTMARRVKDGLMLRMDLMELFCLDPGRPVHPPDGQAVSQMVFML